MKTSLIHYHNDGANKQAQAVLAMLQYDSPQIDFGNTWDSIRLARWENCREQGYVLSLKSPEKKVWKDLHIAWFEHRNSDSIHAIKWEQNALTNSPTIDTAKFGDQVYSDKYDTSFSVGYGEILTMAQWIKSELETWHEEKKELEEESQRLDLQKATFQSRCGP